MAKYYNPGDDGPKASAARILAAEVQRLRAECEKLKHERNRAGMEARKDIMDGIKTERNQATVARIQRDDAREEIQRLRAWQHQAKEEMEMHGGDMVFACLNDL
jgi:uncharacterized protein YicC (UPF0701 family)